MEGTLYLRFNDSNNLGRTGKITFENRSYSLNKHQGKNGKWIQFKTMREDALDNRLKLNAHAINGPNLQLDEFIFIPSN